MATISTANFTALADSVAKTLVDLEAAFQTNPGSNAPTITTITSGQTGNSNSLEARVAALNDVVQERDLAGAAKLAADAVVGYLAISKNAFYALYASFMNALENHVVGASAYLVANTLQVHPEFASAFNYMANNAQQLALRGANATAIALAQIFVPAEQTLASISVTGASTGSFSSGTAVDTTKYGACQLYLKNTGGSPTTGTATSFHITYVGADGNSHTADQALSGALGAGAYLAVGAVLGSAVTAIAVNSGGSSGDAIAVVVKPARTIAY